MTSNFLEVNQISKAYANRTVVDDVSFTIGRSEVVGFVGPNGAGKSTVMKIICGLVKPNAGSVHLAGFDLRRNACRFLAKIGALLDSPGWYPSLTAYEHLAFLTRARGCYDPRLIRSVLESVGLSSSSKKPVSQFSLGMKQRLGVAMAIAHSPEFMILDEPMNGIDPVGMVELRDFIKSIARDRGVTVFVSSHMLAEIEQVCDRVLFLKDGKLIREWSRQEEAGEVEVVLLQADDDEKSVELLQIQPFVVHVKQQEGAVECVVRKGEIGAIAPVLVENKIRLLGLVKQRETLEDVYLSDYAATRAGKIQEEP